jgi:DNA-binding response OmpR family regulator
MDILVAEDNPTTRMLLRAYLTKWKHTAVECDDGGDAWDLLQRPEAPPLAILDWQMPGMDGLEICRRLRQNPGSMLPYVIFVTARDRPNDILTGLQAGADDYITKPFQENELYARLQVGLRVVGLWQRLLEAERNRVLIQTAGAAAHEINNPLNILLGKAQLMQAGCDDKQRRHLDHIVEQGRRIGSIVGKMEASRVYATKPYIKGTDIIDFDQTTPTDPQ